MGLSRVDHIIYGYKMLNKMGEIDILSDKFLPMIEGHVGEEFIIIYDALGASDNIFFGLSVNRCGSDGWDFTEINQKDLESNKVKSKYSELFESEPSEEPVLFIISHIS